MPDYQKGKIYKIISNETNEIYIGSTIQSLSKRLAGHRRDYKNYYGGNLKSFKSSFNILKYGDYKIVLIEEYLCDNKEQLLKREQYYIDNTDCVNKCRAINLLSKEEYNKEQYQIKLKKNPNINKDHYQQRLKNNPNHCKDQYQRAVPKGEPAARESFPGFSLSLCTDSLFVSMHFIFVFVRSDTIFTH